MEFHTKRVYDEPSADDGVRVLVDRLWPRGLKKEKAELDLWPKEVTPSNGLRKWFHAHPDEFGEFSKRYRAELEDQGEAIEQIRSAGDVVTLLTAGKDVEHSQIPVLLGVLES